MFCCIIHGWGAIKSAVFKNLYFAPVVLNNLLVFNTELILKTTTTNKKACGAFLIDQE